MRHASYQTAVIGAAAAGTGVILALLQHDVHELVVLNSMLPTSSLQNQKWLQSGCFYSNNPALARKVWQGFPAMVQLARSLSSMPGKQSLPPK
jgi:shikimate 5-dehydrogenase